MGLAFDAFSSSFYNYITFGPLAIINQTHQPMTLVSIKADTLTVMGIRLCVMDATTGDQGVGVPTANEATCDYVSIQVNILNDPGDLNGDNDQSATNNVVLGSLGVVLVIAVTLLLLKRSTHLQSKPKTNGYNNL
jgi:hypothetical protein